MKEFALSKNVGTTDKIIRGILAVAVFAVGFLYPQIQVAMFAIAAVLALTVVFDFCLLYYILGINTCDENCRKRSTESRITRIQGQRTKSKKTGNNKKR
jgi:hypothetical protein